jgi:hypothetical protein
MNNPNEHFLWGSTKTAKTYTFNATLGRGPFNPLIMDWIDIPKGSRYIVLTTLGPVFYTTVPIELFFVKLHDSHIFCEQPKT